MLKEKEITNATQQPIVFYALHMAAGLAGYENEDILIDTEAMQRMSKSFAAKPLYVGHQEVKLDSIQSDADGWVVRSFYNELDGCLWAECLAISDAAHKAIGNRWAVSNAYRPTEWGSGGSWHNIDYNRKIVNAEFTHLALVPDPRYEEAKIYTPEEFKSYQEQKRNELEELRNSKTGDKKMFKIFKNTKQEVTAGDDLEGVTIEVGGEEKSLVEIINAVKKNAEDEKAAKDKKEKEEKFNWDQEVPVGDTKMSMKDLVNKYNEMCKKNSEVEEGEEEEEKAKKEAAEKKNKEKKNEDEEKKKEEMKNAKSMRDLLNAADKGKAAKTKIVETAFEKEARGKAKY